MSRATDLAKLPRHQVIALWHRTCGKEWPHLAPWVGSYATKEQLVAMIVTEEEER